MKNTSRLIPACIAALAVCAPMAVYPAAKKSSSAASNTAASSPESTKNAAPAAKNKKERAIPFHGMISAVDQTAKTFTIAGKEKGRVFKVTEQTVLTKAGTVATMKDVVANEEVRGSYSKAADGSLEAKTAKLGPMSDAEKAAGSKRSKKKAKAEASTDASTVASPGAAPSTPAKP